MGKATNMRVSQQYLTTRANRTVAKGYTKPRWIEFSETMISYGFRVYLYEARKTYSKYITLLHDSHNGKEFKVRYSDHKPIKRRELANDCDFFVGVTNIRTTNTDQAIEAVLEYFMRR